MTVGELGRRMSRLEFTEWRAFYAYEAKAQEMAMKRAKTRRGR
jgi:hypothetical protein